MNNVIESLMFATAFVVGLFALVFVLAWLETRDSNRRTRVRGRAKSDLPPRARESDRLFG